MYINFEISLVVFMPNIINKSCCYLYLLLLLLLWTVGAARSVIGCEELVPVTTFGYQLGSFI